MPSEVVLTITDQDGLTRRIAVTTARFSIGRSPDNDLPISDSNLSRRHALLETFDGVTYVSDSGSQNGTSVNGIPVAGRVALHDGDRIMLGGSSELLVNLASLAGSVPSAMESQARAGTFSASPKTVNTGATAASTSPLPPWLTPPVIAGASIVFIVFVAGLLVLAIYMSSGSPGADGKHGTNVTNNPPGGNAGNLPQRDSNTPPTNATVPGSDMVNTPATNPSQSSPGTASSSPPANDSTEGTAASGDVADEKVRRPAQEVMRGISTDDKTYTFSPAALHDIARKVQEYQSLPSLPGAFASLKSGGKEVASMAREQGLPVYLVIYAGLAESDGGRSGSPVTAAKSLIPSLMELNPLLGTTTADSSLLVIAALKIPGGNKKSHPLVVKLRKNAKFPIAQRNVWFLHEQNEIDDNIYNYVLRFLALGVIAQNPHSFGVNADPLVF